MFLQFADISFQRLSTRNFIIIYDWLKIISRVKNMEMTGNNGGIMSA